MIDHGRFLHVARRLARDYAKVYYWTPTERDCPLVREACIGDGFKDITRISKIREVRDECDLFVFPDIGFSDLQLDLIDAGKPVWGAREADTLESDRGKFLEVLMTTDLPVPKYVAIKGLTNLALHLRHEEDKYIKISTFRGDWETLHWTNWREMEGTLDSYAVRFGPLKERITFYVFDPIDTEIEDGVDSYCIDGQWPEMVLHGVEAKDKAYLGTMQRMSDVPKETRIANDEFGPILADYGYRGFFSTEVRITKEGESFFIDPTCRCGSPPSQIQGELFANYGEIVWRGANGELVEPDPAAKFGVQAAISIDGDRADWNSIIFHDELDQWVKCGFCCKPDDRTVFPQITEYNTSELGYLCGIGDTIEEAIAHLRHNKDLLPDGVKCEFNSLSDLLAEVQSAEEAGMEFSDQPVPDPATIVEGA